MTEETRTQRALRAANEEIQQDAAAIKGMDQLEKRALVAALILTAVIVAIAMAFAMWGG